ncbi:MAG: radical SAM protein [Firmicutes bacterium]|nr:radical SAM protein [Bacillota bacterium]
MHNVQVRTALTVQPGGFLSGFSHTLQPYVGCAFGRNAAGRQGCPFCYVRRLPVGLWRASPWGEVVRAKVNVATVLERELTRLEERGELSRARIFLGSATDPYQAAEARCRLTRACLQALVRHPPDLLVVQTRSPLVLRDADVLAKLGSRVWVSMTVETDDEAVRRIVTPTSAPIAARIAAMTAMRGHGIAVQAAVSPLLPCDPARLARLLKPACERVIVDTLWHGDGASGGRSRALGMPEMLTAHGWGAWCDERAHEPVFDGLVRAFGASAVGFSLEGWNALERVRRT